MNLKKHFVIPLDTTSRICHRTKSIRGYGDTALDDDLLFDSTVTHPSSSVILFYMTLILIVEMGGTLNNYRVYSPIYIYIYIYMLSGCKNV